MVFMTKKAFEEALFSERRKMEEEMWKQERERNMEKHICELEDRILNLEVKLEMHVSENCCETKKVIR